MHIVCCVLSSNVSKEIQCKRIAFSVHTSPSSSWSEASRSMMSLRKRVATERSASGGQFPNQSIVQQLTRAGN